MSDFGLIHEAGPHASPLMSEAVGGFITLTYQEEEMDMMLSASQERLLKILRDRGPQTLDTLCELPGLTWAQVLLAVDHLSRSRDVCIEPIGPREYQVSLAEGRP